MGRRPSDGPTDAEIEILHALWREGPTTVQVVHDALNRIRPTKYTTALKLMQIMAEKGMVTRDERARRHVYQARLTQEEVQEKLVGNVVERFFDGSCENLVLRALQSQNVSKAEIDRIRQMLDVIEGDES